MQLGAWVGTAKPAVLLDIQRQPGANIIEMVDRVKELLPKLSAALTAGGRHVSILADRTDTIRASVERCAIHVAPHGRAGGRW